MLPEPLVESWGSPLQVSCRSNFSPAFHLIPSSGAVPFSPSPFPNTTSRTFLKSVHCTGHEGSLVACQRVTNDGSCSSGTVGVRCLPGPGIHAIIELVNLLTINGTIRLVCGG